MYGPLTFDLDFLLASRNNESWHFCYTQTHNTLFLVSSMMLAYFPTAAQIFLNFDKALSVSFYFPFLLAFLLPQTCDNLAAAIKVKKVFLRINADWKNGMFSIIS